MQPIIVRKVPGSSGSVGYELVAGERRWRAAQRIGLDKIPSLLRDLDDRRLAEWAIIENLQREDLDPIEQANAFIRLADQFHLTHLEISERVGVDRSTVTNLIRLIDLPQDIQDLIRTGQLTAGHGRCMLGIRDAQAQSALGRKAVAAGWSVRAMEQAVKKLTGEEGALPMVPKAATRSTHIANLEKQIATQLATRVRIRPSKKKNAGTLCIEYYDLDQFDALLQKLGVTLTNE